MSVPIGFLLKKAVGFVLMPFSICFFLFLLGLVYIFRQRFREAVAPFVLGTLLLYIFSLHSFAGFLIRPLERAYAPLDLANSEITSTAVKWVVVLGSGHWSDPDLSPVAILEEAALFRLVEGLRVANHFSESILVLSGGKFRDTQSSAQAMAMAATSMGFDPGRMILLDRPLDTAQEAQQIKDLVGKESLVLVTSASHMLRSMKIMHKQGLSPLPAPVYYRDKGEPEFFLPYPRNMHTCHLAIHEYLGLAWSFVRGQISLSQP
ncbi:MAG: ElyC/SanA/YdcF family protein [Desulfomicrobium sp.]|nr:ElyC/SanA/YdcF family protein [Desulfomicrobium sp.]NLV95999.1 DUF218 domain-containing protein [Desulfovibrionales bacterium]